MSWYGDHQRNLPWRRTNDPFSIWVSEVMLQQTQVKTVIPYYLKFMNAFPSVKDPSTFNQAMMEMGALVCTPAAPKCSDCPLSGRCSALNTQALDRFPVRVPSKRVPTRTIAVGIVRKNGQLLITRRQLDGLLGGLWEFPGGKLEKGEDSQSACIREIREETGIHVKIDSFLTRIKHAYTHFKIEMDVFYCQYVSGEIALTGPIDYKWIHLSQINEFPFPKANLKFIPLIKIKSD